MGSSTIQFLLLLFVSFSISDAQLLPPSTIPKRAGIIFDLERDPSTLQYMIKIKQGTPQSEVKLVVDLGGNLPWLSCHKGHNSSSYHPVSCSSPQCVLANKPTSTLELCNGTANNACSVYIINPVTLSHRKGELISDLVTVASNPDSQDTPVSSPRRCAFGCATTGSILNGLAKTSKGVAGLGRSSALSLVPQLAVAFRFSRIFALDLHDINTDVKSGETGGKIYFGGGPYIHYLFGFDDLKDRDLTYTPLLINPKSKEEYFIDVKSIKVHGITVPINKKLLSINKKTGIGGTKIDTRIPYTSMETSIYKAFTKAYIEWAESFNNANAELNDFLNITRVTPVAPFTTCFNSSTVPLVRMFQNNDPPGVAFIFPKSVWNISLFDMVRVNDGVDCVGFVDGGSKPKTSIVIGARQIGFLEFDISRSRLGFQQPNLREF
ncbi:basic 7S globulin-like [Papaver somniferum]|uniref:basic 7S globulin-like n=1 Tax=Papaver somniferum TaxID=3469 RepID=UPI000E6F8826|nr:basic 7S globulin-like [Papaver somniferum]